MYQQRRIIFEIGKPEKVNADTLLYKQLASGNVRIGQFGHSVDEGPVAHIENDKMITVDLSSVK